MVKHQVCHIIECSVEDYWKRVFFNYEHNRDLFLNELHFARWEMLKQEDQGDAVLIVVEAAPRMPELPGPLKKLLTKGVGYREEGHFDKKILTYNVRATSDSLGDKLSITGRTTTRPVGSSRCERHHESIVDAKLFGVGGLLEKRIIKDVEKSYAKAAAFTNAWLARQS